MKIVRNQKSEVRNRNRTGRRGDLREQAAAGWALFTASPWAYGGRVFCINEEGLTFVVEAGDEFKLLHTNTLEDEQMCLATPALVGDRLLIRTATQLYCIRSARQ